MSGDIFLNIDTIVLRGLGNINRRAIAEELEQALTEQLSQANPWNPGNLAKVQTQISLPTINNANLLGQSLAEALGGILTDSQLSTPHMFLAGDAKVKDDRNV